MRQCIWRVPYQAEFPHVREHADLCKAMSALDILGRYEEEGTIVSDFCPGPWGSLWVVGGKRRN
jgi:hypothetical protein